MISKHFTLNVLARVVVLSLTLLLTVWLLVKEGFVVTQGLCLLLVVIQVYWLYRYVRRTNEQLSRFLLATRFEDYNATFDSSSDGAGFKELGLAFTQILKTLQNKREHQEETANWLKSVIEHVPVPLISLHPDDRITLWNSSARRLFGTTKVVRLEDLKCFGGEFYEALNSASSDARRLVKFTADGMEHQLSISVREVTHGGERERVVSLQDIAGELDKARLQAWQDLVRVLTHEIINSITPIASLSNTAATLLQQNSDHQSLTKEDLDDAESAIATVAKRSSSLMAFVNNYRQITHLPAPHKQPVKLSALLGRIATLFAHDWVKQGVQLHLQDELQRIEMEADPQMLEQLFINLFKNAQQAKPPEQETLTINVGIALNKRNKVMLTVSDNGAGIPDDIRNSIFVPFFTTKKQGSGVGLALARQIMLVHGGSIRLDEDASEEQAKGTTFTLVFP